MGRWVLTVPGRFPGLNDYVDACKNPRGRARVKRECDEMVAWAVMSSDVPRLKPPVKVTVDCYEPNRRRDKDNVHAMARKFVLDGLQAAGVIGNDNWDWIPELTGGSVQLDRLYPRVEITLEGEEE